VQVVTTGEAQALSQNPEVNTMIFLPVNHCVHGSVDVQ
jgi:hypothetical protein